MSLEHINKDRIERRAKSIAAMGLVNREGNKFIVSTPSLRGHQISQTVSRNEQGKVVCNCLQFEEYYPQDANFRCEHILAVKFYLVRQNNETNQSIQSETKDAQNPSEAQRKTSERDILLGYSIRENENYSKTIDIQYANETTVYPYIIQVNKDCPNQKETAQKIVNFLNQAEKIQFAQQTNAQGFPNNPVAVSLMDLITAKQLGMIRAISREIGIEADKECQTVLNCKTDELSKKAASAFIQHLQDLQRQQSNSEVF